MLVASSRQLPRVRTINCDCSFPERLEALSRQLMRRCCCWNIFQYSSMLYSGPGPCMSHDARSCFLMRFWRSRTGKLLKKGSPVKLRRRICPIGDHTGRSRQTNGLQLIMLAIKSHGKWESIFPILAICKFARASSASSWADRPCKSKSSSVSLCCQERRLLGRAHKLGSLHSRRKSLIKIWWFWRDSIWEGSRCFLSGILVSIW